MTEKRYLPQSRRRSNIFPALKDLLHQAGAFAVILPKNNCLGLTKQILDPMNCLRQTKKRAQI